MPTKTMYYVKWRSSPGNEGDTGYSYDSLGKAKGKAAFLDLEEDGPGCEYFVKDYIVWINPKK